MENMDTKGMKKKGALARIQNSILAKERMEMVLSQISTEPSIAIMAHINLDPTRASTLIREM